MKRLKDINWNHLYSFYEVAKAQSLKKGAQATGTSPSTMSEQLKRLETKLGSKLFFREPKGLRLTSDGDLLFERCKVMFEEGSKLLEFFSEDVVGGYPVNVGIEEAISYDIAAEFCSQYWDMYTEYGTVNTLRQAESTILMENLSRGNIDWAISLQKPRRNSLDYAEIGSFEIHFCCSDDLYDKFIDKKDIIKNIPLAQSFWDKGLNREIDKYLRANDIVPKEKLFSDHPEFIKKLCQRGRCIMILPQNPLGDYEGLKSLTLESAVKLPLYAIWKRGDEGLISIKKLKELIKSKLSEIPSRYEDVELQIEVSEISDELLK